MVNELALRVNQCFRPFTMLRVDGLSQMGLFRYLSNHDFRGTLFRKFISYESHLFSKMFKIWFRFENCTQKFRKSFWFSDKCIWIVCIELSLLRTEYLSSAVNVLTKSLKTLHFNRSDFFQLNSFHNDLWIW